MHKPSLTRINKRNAKLGTGINTRTQYYGEESKAAIDVKILEIGIEKAELDALLGPGAWDRYYFQPEDSKGTNVAIEPFCPRIAPFCLTDIYEDATVTIWAGIDNVELKFEKVKISKVCLQLAVGGLTLVSLMMHCQPESTPLYNSLHPNLDKLCSVKIAFGKLTAKEAREEDKQAELALDASGDATPPPKEEDSPASSKKKDTEDFESGMSRKIRASEMNTKRNERRRASRAEAKGKNK